MNNPRITARERGLLKGAIRRVFARADLRREVINDAVMKDHTDTTRPRVKVWVKCAACSQPTPKSYCVVDHIVPVIPVDSSFEELGLDATADRTWCQKENLQAICPDCHAVKTKEENAERRKNRKKVKNTV